MTYEQRMQLMSRVKPEFKDLLLLRLLRGETIDITKDEDLFYQVNKDRVTLEQFTNRDRFKADVAAIQRQRKFMHDPKYGKTKGKKMRWLGDIPAEIYFSRPEFSKELDKGTREKNIRNWLNQFPSFRAGESQV